MSSFIDQEQANYVSQNNYPPKNNSYPTLTIQGGETTPIFHGVTIRMCRIHKGSKEIFNKEITIKLHHK